MNSRRDLLKTVGAGMLLKLIPVGAFAADQVKFVDVRLWPADEYTRVTLEHAGAIKYKHFLIENPWRMVIDLLDMLKVDQFCQPRYAKFDELLDIDVTEVIQRQIEHRHKDFRNLDVADLQQRFKLQRLDNLDRTAECR